MTLESWAEWVRRPEWAYLVDWIQDELDGATVALVSADANDRAQIGRIQAAIRYFRSFIDGEVRLAIEEELKEKEAKNG